jgi:recombinational DNA repair ATPase RecF
VRRRDYDKLMELRERLLENNGPSSLSAAWALWAIEQKMKRMGVSLTLGSTE